MCVCLRRLTFELSRPWRQAGLAVRSTINQRRRAAKPGCRSGSALERGVRPHRVCADEASRRQPGSRPSAEPRRKDGRLWTWRVRRAARCDAAAWLGRPVPVACSRTWLRRARSKTSHLFPSCSQSLRPEHAAHCHFRFRCLRHVRSDRPRLRARPRRSDLNCDSRHASEAFEWCFGVA
jgi:hypothetical protein